MERRGPDGMELTTGRPLPMAGVREPTPRARRHAVMAAVVGAYLGAALVVALAGGSGERPRWLALHLLGLGAATNAVVVWSRHFAQALLHARVGAERPATMRLIALNVGVLAVLVGVLVPVAAIAAAGAAVVVTAIAWHAASLLMMARRHRLPGPLRGVVGFYVASATCLVVGAGIGAALAGQWVADDSTAQQRLHVAHAQLNLFGWIGLAVLGTLVVLWPAVLRTRMVDVAPRVSRWTLALCVTGLAVLVTGVLTGTRDVAVAGVAGYGVGVVSALVTMARTLPGRPSRSSAAWWLGASCCWLLVGVAVDAQRLATPRDADVTLRPLVPILAAGLVGQALVGALTFLLPVTIGGGPQGNRRMTDLLERVWPVRLVLADVGIALVAVPAPPAVHIVGWAAALTGLGSFLPLLTAALVRRAQTPA